MKTIDISAVMEALPLGVTVELKHKKGELPYFHVVLTKPLSPLLTHESQDNVTSAIGVNNINVFLTHESGLIWLIFLVSENIKFINPSKKDVANYTLKGGGINTPN